MKLTCSQFAVIIALAIVILSLASGYAVGRYARPEILTCTVVVADGFGHKHEIYGVVK